MQRKVWGWMTAGILVSSGLGFYGFSQLGAIQAQSTQPAPPPATGSPDPGVDPDRVGALGRIEPQGEVIDVGGPTGERIGELRIREGQQVSKGDILVQLENYAERLAERDYVAAQLAEAQSSLQANLTVSQAQIEETRTRLEQLDQPRLQEIEAHKATIRQVQAELADAQRDERRFLSLFKEGAVSQEALDERTLGVQQKEESLRNAQATLGKWEVTRSTDMTNARAQVREAEANLNLVRTQNSIASLSRNLDLANARLERTLIRAPRDGQILKVVRFPGEVISADEGIVQLGNTQQMYVVAEIYETDIARIRLGQAAQVSSDAFPDVLQGTVDYVGLQIGKKDVLNTDPAADVDARVVEVKIKLDPSASQQVATLTNLQVTVEIALNKVAG